jgi:dienelactone hydrolase
MQQASDPDPHGGVARPLWARPDTPVTMTCTRTHSVARARVAFICLALLLAVSGPASAADDDCAGPVAEDPAPGSPEWEARDANNQSCAAQRHSDQTLHPVSPLPSGGQVEGLAPLSLTDAYREPSRQAGRRFRYAPLTILNRDGAELAAEIYRPCAPGTCDGLPGELHAVAPSYPGVVVLHGGGSRKELHWWSAQTLAEAGYMTVSFNGAAGNRANAEDVVDWLLSTPEQPAHGGRFNPHWRELDRERVGLAGHSMGGQTASVLGQDDPRVDAIVAWDRGTNIPLPARLRTPTLFFVADYACQANPVCQPEPYSTRPQGEGPRERGKEYDIVRAAGIDAMKVVLRATTHLDWTLSEPAGNRYGETVSVYYTLAWFDRYLRGADDPAVAQEALRRLTASRFDDYADRHNISQGEYDAARAAAQPDDPYAGNVPYTIAGVATRNLMSFYFPSKCSITGLDGSRLRSENMRAEGCPVRERCLRPSGVAFRLRRTQGRRIVRVTVSVNGKRRLRRSGRNITRVTVPRLPRTGRMTVRIVATDHHGDKLISTRTWNGCVKGRPSVRAVHS